MATALPCHPLTLFGEIVAGEGRDGTNSATRRDGWLQYGSVCVCGAASRWEAALLAQD